MADRRHEQDLAEARSADELEARRDQSRDAARIHRELADTDRIAAVIDELLHDDAGA